MSEQEKEAALAFARTKPVEWDQYLEQWVRDHPTVKEEPTPKKEETKRTTTKRES